MRGSAAIALALAVVACDREEKVQRAAGPVLGARVARPIAGEDGASARVSSWPIFRGNPALHGLAAGSLPDSLSLLWSHDIGAAITSSAVIAAGRIYVGSDTMKLHVLDLHSGEELWARASGDFIEAPPLVHAGRVYVGSTDGFLYAFDAASGAPLWKFETMDQIVASANWWRDPATGKTRILFGSYDNRLYCAGATDGKKLWVYQSENYINGTPAVHGEWVIFGGCDASLHVISIRDGHLVARHAMGSECYIGGSVAVAQGAAWFGHYGGFFQCVDLRSGKVRWSYGSGAFPFFSSPAIEEDVVVFGGRDKRLHCVQRRDGKPLWTFATRRRIDASPVLIGDKVLFGSDDGRLRMVDLGTGKGIWSYAIGQPLVASPAVADGIVVIGSTDGKVYAFGSEREDR